MIISVHKTMAGIFELQYRHLAFRNTKETIGNKSLNPNLALHEKQKDLPLHQDKPVLYLSATTFTKLPIAAPKIITQNK